MRRTALTGGRHEAATLESVEDGYVVLCACGWRSAPHVLVESFFLQWEKHSAATHVVAVDDGTHDGQSGDGNVPRDLLDELNELCDSLSVHERNGAGD